MTTVARTVETFASGESVTFYRCPAPANVIGNRLTAELLAAGLPDRLDLFDTTTDPDGRPLERRTHVAVSGPEVHIYVPEDTDDHSDLIAQVVDAHLGTEHPDEVALREFVDAVDDAARRLLDGEAVEPEAVAVLIAVGAGRA